MEGDRGHGSPRFYGRPRRFVATGRGRQKARHAVQRGELAQARRQALHGEAAAQRAATRAGIRAAPPAPTNRTAPARWRRPPWPSPSAPPAPAAACGTQAGASSCVSLGGRTSIGASAQLLPLLLVALRQRGDQAVDALGVDLLRELAAVGIDQPDAEHVQVVDLPAAGLARRLLEPVVELDRVAAAAHLGAHQHFLVVGRAAERAHGHGLVADLVERAGVGAHQQGLELFLQALLLLGRGLAPGRAHGGGGHALEVHVRHDLGVDQHHDLVDVAGLDRLVGLDGLEHVGREALDQRVGRFVGGMRGPHEARQPRQRAAAPASARRPKVRR